MTERQKIESLRDELFALCEDTEEHCADGAAADTPTGSFLRGRVFEAKGIRKAMGEMFRLALVDGELTRPAGKEG